VDELNALPGAPQLHGGCGGGDGVIGTALTEEDPMF
jgi:hypothetical protein